MFSIHMIYQTAQLMKCPTASEFQPSQILTGTGIVSSEIRHLDEDKGITTIIGKWI